MVGTGRGETAFDLVRAVWARRKGIGTAVFAHSFCALAGVAVFLPDVYRSTATVLVERHQVPEAFVRASVIGEVEPRLQMLSQEILSRARLQDLITRFDLYSDLRRVARPELIVERMRRDIDLDLKGVQEGGGRAVTVAFALSYQGRDPGTVATVTNTLASFYVEENQKARGRVAAGTAALLKTQLEEAKARLQEQEERVAEFKNRHMGELPEQVEVNLATLERLNSELQMNSDNRLRLAERRAPEGRPLAEEGGAETPAERLERLQGELENLRARFSDKYPDVIRLKAEIAALEQAAGQEAAPERARGNPAGPADPAARRIDGPHGDLEAEIRALEREEARLKQSIQEYQKRVEIAPQREQELQVLVADRARAKDLYDSLVKRYDEAQLAETMETLQTGEHFRILDPAVPSAQPAAPSRPRLLLMGLLLALAIGAGAALLVERLDTSFHSTEDLRAFTRVPVLASIPRILTPADAARRRRRRWLAASSAVLGLAFAAGAAYLVAHENEALVQLMLRGRS